MKELQISRLEEAMGAATRHDGVVHAISTDSRAITPRCLFIALEGERFDGHAYINSALSQGAAFAVAHKQGDYPADRVIYVKDTGKALLDAARCYRQQLRAKVVAVTGSVGKTSTKEMIYAVLSSQFDTIKTEGNLNNEIGLPKTLLQIEETTQAAVVEMGMSGFGEIEELALSALPDIGVITNIGVSHMEALGSRENILKAKMELVKGMADGAPLILCGDNDLLRTVQEPRLRVVTYGMENMRCNVVAKELEQQEDATEFSICWGGRSVRAKIPCIGRHNVQNALAAFCVGLQMGMHPEAAAAALSRFQSSGMRQKMVPFHGFTVVEDCYNASPDSMRAAIITFGECACRGKKILVLADMLELGTISEQSHYEVGKFAASHGVDLLLAYGPQAVEYVRGARQAGLNALHYSEKYALVEELKKQIKPDDMVWFKGSRGMKLEEAIRRIYEEC